MLTSKPEEVLKLENHNAMVRAHYVIKTFDKVLEETEAMLENLLKLSTIEKTK